MAGPPKGVPPSELFSRLSQRPRPTREVEFPTKGDSIGRTKMWVLSEEEMHQARRAARDEASIRLGPDAKAGDIAYEEIYRDEVLVQILCMACRAVENTMVPSFPTAAMARKILTTDELGVLAQAYAVLRVEAGPMLSEMTTVEMENWRKVLRDGASMLPLSRVSLEGLQALTLHFATTDSEGNPLASSTDSTSAGLPVEISSPSDTP